MVAQKVLNKIETSAINAAHRHDTPAMKRRQLCFAGAKQLHFWLSVEAQSQIAQYRHSANHYEAQIIEDFCHDLGLNIEGLKQP